MPALAEDGQTAVDVSEALQHSRIGGFLAGVDERVTQFRRHARLDARAPMKAPGISDDFQQGCPQPPDRIRTPPHRRFRADRNNKKWGPQGCRLPATHSRLPATRKAARRATHGYEHTF